MDTLALERRVDYRGEPEGKLRNHKEAREAAGDSSSQGKYTGSGSSLGTFSGSTRLKLEFIMIFPNTNYSSF